MATLPFLSISAIVLYRLIHFIINSLIRFSTSNTTGQSTDSRKVLRAFDAIDVVYDRRMVTLEWVASPVNDMYADGILCSILQAESMESMPSYIPSVNKEDKMHFKECLIEMLQVHGIFFPNFIITVI